jgi:3-methyladenine DNA glycosylase AlkD
LILKTQEIFMPPAKKHAAARKAPARKTLQLPPSAEAVIARLKRLGTKAALDGMARYAIPSDNAMGVTVGTLIKLAKELGRDHELAAALWDSGWYEARMLAASVDLPEAVTPAQMDRWCRDFDNWAICDHVCFHLFDRTPHAWQKVDSWSKRREEFPKRAAFALLWSLSVHDKKAADASFLHGLSLLEREAGDDRHFVKKGVNMALRAIGKRNATLHAAALEVARRLVGSVNPSAAWVGKDAVRELEARSPKKR